MHKGLGAKAQRVGHRRTRKNLKRKHRKLENLAYVSRLMFKYGRDLNLKTRPNAGETYLKAYLNG
jgi:hypothetical protein